MTVPKIELPPLPEQVTRIEILHTVGTTPSQPELGDWRDLPHEVATVIDADRRKALATCAKRTVWVILDVRHGKTQSWLPAWQFHSESGDGSTPAAEQPIKACLTRQLAHWTVATLPENLLELELAIR